MSDSTTSIRWHIGRLISLIINNEASKKTIPKLTIPKLTINKLTFEKKTFLKMTFHK